jgi:hypothetical protein
MRIDNVPVLVDVRGPSPSSAIVLNNGPATAFYGATAALAAAHDLTLLRAARVTLTSPTWFVVASPASGFPVVPANLDVQQVDAAPSSGGGGGGSVTANQQAALDAASSPTSSNAFMTASAVDGVVGVHAADSTSVHGIADTSALTTSAALASGLAGKADTADLTSGLAGKADTSALTSGLAGKANTSHTHTVSSLGTGTPASGKYLDGAGAWTTLPAGGGGGSVSANEQAALDAAASPTASNEFMTASAVDAAITAALAGFTSSGLPPNAGLVVAQEADPDATTYPQLWVPTDSTRTLQVGPVGWVASGTPTAPAQVTGLSATPGSAQVALSWTAPSSGGSAITDYTVQYRVTSVGGAWSTFSHTAGTATSRTVTGLTNGTGYDFQVAAVNSVGTGTYSSTIAATPTASPTAPGAPTGLSLTPGNAQIAASWTAPASNGGSAITTYLVEYRTPSGSGSYTTFSHSASTTPSITITGLTNGSVYGVRVSAVNAVGTGTATAESTATPAATGGAVIIEDAFTGTDGALLSAHTVAPTGGPVTVFNAGAYTAAWTVKSNRVYSDGDYALAHYDPAPATNEYDIECVIRCVSTASGFVAIVGRATFASLIATHYEFRIDVAGGLTLYEAPAYTSLGTAAQTFTPGQDYTVKAEIRTATKKLYVDGVQKISSSTDAITQIGKAGISAGAATATSGLHIDNFKVTNA